MKLPIFAVFFYKIRSRVVASRLFAFARGELHFFLPFACVGAGGFVVDAISLKTLIWLFAPSSVLQTLLLRCIGFSLGIYFTWICNKNWTFREQKRAGSLLYYYPLMVLGGLVNLSVFTLCLMWLAIVASHPELGVALGTAAAMFVNFASMRLLVFRTREV